MISIKEINEYLNKEIIPFIIEKDLDNDTIIVVGGSYSYGFYDEKSDVDIFIFMKKGIGDLISRFRQNLFRHIDINGYKVQIIPMDLNNQISSSIDELLSCPEAKVNKIAIDEIYKCKHYIPVFDPKNKIDKVKIVISSLNEGYWSKKCQELCCETIDFLESFYSSLTRCNVAAIIKFGSVVKALLQIIYLTDNKPYPPDKWLNIGMSEKHKNTLSDSLGTLIPKGIDEECLKNYVDSLNKYVTNILSSKKIVPSYIIDDMLDP